MSHLFLRICRGCHRRALCQPAPRTPPDEYEDHLYCDDCHDVGRAIYLPIAKPTDFGFFCLLIGAIVLGAGLTAAAIVWGQ